MTFKETCKHLKNIASELPPDKYEAVHGYYKDTRKTEHPVNHYRRLKRLWKRYKNLAIINEYLWRYGRELRKL